MAFQPLSVGDVLMLSQTAWKVGRAFAHGKKSAPSEFAEVEREANGLSEALKLVAETLHSSESELSAADDETRSAVNTILQSAHKTLDDLDSFVDRYQVIKKKETNGGFVVERSWSEVVVANFRTFKWTTEGGTITDLRNMLQMHTNSINLTMQALQSRSLARLEKTVVPMAENIATIHDRVQGDLGQKIDDLHRIIMSIASSTPSLVARDRAIESSGSHRDSNSTPFTLDRASANYYVEDSERNDRMLEPPPLSPHVFRPPRSSSYYAPPPRPVAGVSAARPIPGNPTNKVVSSRSKREDSAYYSSGQPSYHPDANANAKHMDWDFESGSPIDRRSSIGGYIDHDSHTNVTSSPQDSAYAPTVQTESRRASQARRESATLPSLMKAIEDDLDAIPGSSREVEEVNVSPKSKKSWRTSSGVGQLPPPAIPADDKQRSHPPATPTSIFSTMSRTKSMPLEEPPSGRPQTAKSMGKRQSQPQPSYTEGPKFERLLFRNAAILCDVRGTLVEQAQTKPDEPDPRYNVEMVEACRQARICVVRKRENKEHGGTKVVTSVWCLSDDGETRLQQKLSEFQETVPYCSYFDPEKVSLQSTGEPISLRLHGEQWGGMLKEEIKTNWVNYYFETENDAVAFQSAVFGRQLLGSYRTTKTTVIHEGLSGVFAFEEQFANIEMLRLWEDDGVSTPGAQGGVMALMHISSNFGEGWARWWINNSHQHVRVKEDGFKWARVKGINVTVVRPPKVIANAGDNQVKALQVQNQPVKRVHGIRIEFKTDNERTKFVSAAKKAQGRTIPLPELAG